MKQLILSLAFLCSMCCNAQTLDCDVDHDGRLTISDVTKVIDAYLNYSDDDYSDPYNGHEFVDLGLSVKWATMNVGATTPEGYGDYFAWGETSPKETYTWSNLKYCSGSTYEGPFTKYVASSFYGNVDKKTVIDLSDDAAHANWGGDWRMPTIAEQDELRNNCTWTWTTQNGVNGYKVASKTNDNSIFLPAAGFRTNSDLFNAGSYGYYWSSSLNADYSYGAYGLYFGSGSVSRYSGNRYYGRSVRAVCQ